MRQEPLLGNGERLRGQVQGEVDAHLLHHGRHAAPRRCPVHKAKAPGAGRAQHEVLQAAELGDQVQLLVNEGKAQAHGVLRVMDDHGLTIQADGTRVRVNHAGQDPHHRGLARSVCAHQAVDLPAAHREVHALEGVDPAELLFISATSSMDCLCCRGCAASGRPLRFFACVPSAVGCVAMKSVTVSLATSTPGTSTVLGSTLPLAAMASARASTSVLPSACPSSHSVAVMLPSLTAAIAAGSPFSP